MDFELTEEQIMIQEMARKVSQDVLAKNAQKYDETEDIPYENYKKLGELQLFGITVPEEYGGPGLDNVSYALAMIELSKGCAGTATTVSVQNSLINDILLRFGTEEQKKKYLPKIVNGEIFGTFALTETSAGSDPASLKTKAVKSGNEYIINGRKMFASCGYICSFAILFATINPELKHRGITAFIVDRDNPGFKVGKKEKKMGIRASDTVELIFEDCRVPESSVLGEVGMGFKVAMEALDGGRIGIAAQAQGIGEAAFESALKYSMERIQFNAPISSNQAIQFLLADMATRLDASKLLILRAAWLKDQKKIPIRESSMAKVFASETAGFVVDKALQIHGGYGYIKDYDVERYYRDHKITEIYEGTSEIQRLVIAKTYIDQFKK